LSKKKNQIFYSFTGERVNQRKKGDESKTRRQDSFSGSCKDHFFFFLSSPVFLGIKLYLSLIFREKI